MELAIVRANCELLKPKAVEYSEISRRMMILLRVCGRIGFSRQVS